MIYVIIYFSGSITAFLLGYHYLKQFTPEELEEIYEDSEKFPPNMIMFLTFFISWIGVLLNLSLILDLKHRRNKND
jgi:hypothetical protein